MENNPPIMPTNEEISKYDDVVASSLVVQCRDIMHTIPTVTCMKVCYNLTSEYLSLFCVQGSKKSVTALANQFYKGLIEQINERFDGR